MFTKLGLTLRRLMQRNCKIAWFTEKFIRMSETDKQYSHRRIQHLLHACIIFLTNRGTLVVCIAQTVSIAS